MVEATFLATGGIVGTGATAVAIAALPAVGAAAGVATLGYGAVSLGNAALSWWHN